MPEEYLRRLDFVLASFHDICIEPKTLEEHTEAVINVLKILMLMLLPIREIPNFRWILKRL